MAEEYDGADVPLDEDVDEHQHETQRKQREFRVEIGTHDTPKAKTEEIVSLAKSALESLAPGYSHKDAATALKRKLDEKYRGTWHVIVGTHFGGNVTNDAASLVNFKLDGVSFLVLRSGPPDRPLSADGEAAQQTE